MTRFKIYLSLPYKKNTFILVIRTNKTLLWTELKPFYFFELTKYINLFIKTNYDMVLKCLIISTYFSTAVCLIPNKMLS